MVGRFGLGAGGLGRRAGDGDLCFGGFRTGLRPRPHRARVQIQPAVVPLPHEVHPPAELPRHILRVAARDVEHRRSAVGRLTRGVVGAIDALRSIT